MDTLVNFLNQPIGDVLAFLGIALTYFFTALFDNVRKDKWPFYVAATVFVILAFLALTRGTTKAVDAGLVLGYLGIGTGLICTAWSNRSHKAAYWTIFAIGSVFEIIGLILIHHAGLI